MDNKNHENTDLEIAYHDDDWDPHSGTIDNFDKPFVLYQAREQAIRRYNKFGLTAILVVAPLLLISMFASGVFPWPITAGCYLLLVCTFLVTRRKVARTVRPILKMNNDGIELHTLAFDVFIPWEQIEESYTYSSFMIKHVGIVPYNRRLTLSKTSLVTRLTSEITAAVDPLFSLFGAPSTPIWVLESDLPLPADEVAELINNRRNHFLALKQAE